MLVTNFSWADSEVVTTGNVQLLINAEIPPPPPGYATGQEAIQAIHKKIVAAIDQSLEFPNVETRQNVRYSETAGERGVLDLYLPKVAGEVPSPGIILVHGGGWRAGSKEDYRYYGQQFAHRGIVSACINYRLVPQGRFPTQIQDVKCAIRWMRSNAAELNVDPQRIAVMGGSAGGHLALLAAYASEVDEFENVGGHHDVASTVQAVVNIYGPTDFEHDFGQAAEMVPDMIREFLGEENETVKKNRSLASPLTHLDAGDPPTLIIHGTIDRLVPIKQGDRLAEKLKDLDVPYVYDRIPGWPHGMDIAKPINDRVLFLVENFLKNSLIAPHAERSDQ